MSEYDLLNMLQSHESKNEKSFEDFIKAIIQKKYIVIITVLLALGIAYMYNAHSVPLYQSKVLLKKDKPSNSYIGDEFKEILTLHTRDMIETEMELVRTTNVLKKVVDDLKLYLTVDNIVQPGGKIIPINETYVNYKHDYLENKPNGDKYPVFVDVKVEPNNQSMKLEIKKISQNNYQLYDANTGSYWENSQSGQLISFNLPTINLEIYWPSADDGSMLYLTAGSYAAAVGNLKSSVSVNQLDNTDLFQIGVVSYSPYLAQKIAETLAEKFKETRIEQQRENIKYSFNFVDQQLQDIAQKLKAAEGDLSNFKSSNHITNISDKSNQLVEFLSGLESEKIKTELELAEYQNKKKEMEDEYKAKGMFDQTYLSPSNNNNQYYSPFTTLQQQLANLELKKIEIMKRRSSTHPDVINIDNQISELKNKMSDYNQNTLAAYQIIINTNKKKLNQLENLSNNYKDMIDNLPPKESKLAELVRIKTVYEKVFTILLNKREEMRVAELSKLQDISVVESASLPSGKVYPKTGLNYFIAIILGTISGIFIIWVMVRTNRKLDNLNEIEDELKLPIFAIIPPYPRKIQKQIANSSDYDQRFVVLMHNKDKFLESFNLLRLNILNALKDHPKLIMFTSCEEHTGKTSILANLAFSLAQSNKKVLIIDCDMKRSKLSRIFDLPSSSPGLYQFLQSKDAIPSIYNILKNKNGFKTARRLLDIIPSGAITKHSSDLLASDRMEKLIELIKKSSYEYILFDTPPATRVIDPLVLGRFIQNTIVVIRPDITYKDSIIWGIKEMEKHDLKIIGTVVNACDIEHSAYRYKYGYGYQYEYAEIENSNGTAG